MIYTSEDCLLLVTGCSATPSLPVGTELNVMGERGSPDASLRYVSEQLVTFAFLVLVARHSVDLQV